MTKRCYLNQEINGCKVLEEMDVPEREGVSPQVKHQSRTFRVLHLKTGIELVKTLGALRNFDESNTNPYQLSHWIDLTGQEIGDWVVIGLAESSRDFAMGSVKSSNWICRNKHTGHEVVRSGKVILKGQPLRAKNHSYDAKDYYYRLWQSLKKKCHSSNLHYLWGGMGIGLCDEWLFDFARFREDLIDELGPRPSKKHTLFLKSGRTLQPGNVDWVVRGNNQKPTIVRYADRLDPVVQQKVQKEALVNGF